MKIFTCEVCGKEFEAKRSAKTCSKACRTAKWRAENPESKINVTSDTVTHNQHSDIAALRAEIMALRMVIERQTTTIELMALNQAASPKAGMSQKELPIAPKPIDTSDLVVEVKKSAKQDGNVQATNFLNSIMALNG